jgi:WhiB family redox-sensing transcriptional regulator
MNEPRNDSRGKNYEELAAELDELSMVPTEVLADWVTARGRCLWETTFSDPPEWSGEQGPDGELATRLCAGCPVRAECLEFELRVAGEDTVGVWGALNQDDRRALHKVWTCRRRTEIEALGTEEREGGES